MLDGLLLSYFQFVGMSVMSTVALFLYAHNKKKIERRTTND